MGEVHFRDNGIGLLPLDAYDAADINKATGQTGYRTGLLVSYKEYDEIVLPALGRVNLCAVIHNYDANIPAQF